MKRKVVFIAMVLLAALTEANADTVRLKNGGVLEGIVTSEDGQNLILDVGFGTVTIEKDEIDRINRASPEEIDVVRQRWEEKRKELKAREKEFEEERDRRFREAYEDRLREAAERRLEEAAESKEIQARRDIATKSIVVDAVLNGRASAKLVLDTGASLVVLSRKMGEALGLDLSEGERDIVQLRLAGNKTIKAKTVILDSVAIQGVEIQKVLTAVLIEDCDDTGFKDGLLGMSFLSKFNLKIDLKTMRITMEKI